MAQTFELKHEREENARRAVFEERVRIARELHDVVAHHVSVMGVQACWRPGGSCAGTRTRRNRRSSTIEEASRQAVRRDGPPARLPPPTKTRWTICAPQPGLGQLDELVAQRVERRAVGRARPSRASPRGLPRTVEVSAYRVVQEALTNTLKHSGGATASVRVSYGTEASGGRRDRRGPGSPGATRLEGGGGHGLMGMRERVGLHGGHAAGGTADRRRVRGARPVPPERARRR